MKGLNIYNKILRIIGYIIIMLWTRDIICFLYYHFKY